MFLSEVIKGKVIKPPKDTPKEVAKLFDTFNDMDRKYSGMGMSNEMSKLYKQIKSLGYWISNTQGKVQLNKKGFDQQGKKIDHKNVGIQY